MHNQGGPAAPHHVIMQQTSRDGLWLINVGENSGLDSYLVQAALN